MPRPLPPHNTPTIPILFFMVLCHRLCDEVASSEPGLVESPASTSSSLEAALATLSLSALTLTTLTLAALSLALTLTLTLTLTALSLTSLTAVLAIVGTLTTVLAVVAAVVTTILAAIVVTNGKSNTVILGATLSNRHENGLMVAGGGHGASTVYTGRKTSSKICTEKSLAVSVVVDTLEESEVLGVQGGLPVGVALHVLNSDVGVTNDLTAIERLRCGVIRSHCSRQSSGR
jgi:hypothetical protein